MLPGDFTNPGKMTTMEQPPLTQAPLDWLKTVVQDTPSDADDKMFNITIQSAEDGKDYTFAYRLGNIRAELQQRQSN